MSSNTKISGASREAIQYHYDLSNEFYSTWLDPLMVYSCGLWDDAHDLPQAQIHKLDYHILQAHAIGKDHVLDIGCGWGALLERLVDEYGVAKAVGLTLSEKQYQYIHGRKNTPSISVLLESWEDHIPEKPYDAIISIGAFEHFAKQGLSETERVSAYKNFFKKCHSILNDNGRVSLQTIGCGNMLREDFSRFFADEVFPESDLPRLSEIFTASEFLFEVKNMRNDRFDYAQTLKIWKKNLKENQALALKYASESDIKKYEKYFSLAIISFEYFGSMDLYRITFQKTVKPRIQ